MNSVGRKSDDVDTFWG